MHKKNKNLKGMNVLCQLPTLVYKSGINMVLHHQLCFYVGAEIVAHLVRH